jgi:hypothetical protein
MNERDPFAKLLVAVNARKPQHVADLLVLVPQGVGAKLLLAEIAAEVFLALQGVTFHVVLAQAVLPLEGEILVHAFVVGAEKPAPLLSHGVVSLGNIVHRLGGKQRTFINYSPCTKWQLV